MRGRPGLAAQLAVVAVGQHLVAEEEDQVAAAAEVGVQHAGLAGGELGHVAEEDAVVAAQVALQQGAFGGHVDDDRGRLAARRLGAKAAAR